MTTIAFDGKRLAVDSRVCDNERVTSERAQKLWLINGRWYAFFGGMEGMMLAVEWFGAGMPKEKPSLPDSFGCLSWSRKSRPLYYERGLVSMSEEAPILAYGSGGRFAIGAMAAGADAVQAVKIAARFDPFTNARVQVSK